MANDYDPAHLISVRKTRTLSEFDDAIRQLEREFGSADQRFQRTANAKRLAETRRKRRMIPTLQETLAEIRHDHSILFVSLSKRLTSELDSLRKIAAHHRFTEVHTGFDPDMYQRGTLREGIFGKIAKSSAFLGVWSDDIPIAAGLGETPRSSPGVWMPLELGAAVYANKPFYLLLKEGVGAEFVKPVGELPHGWYRDQRSFDETAEELIHGLRKKLDKAGEA